MSLTQIAIDADTLARLDALAQDNTATREETLKAAVEQYYEYDRWYRAKVATGERDYREGRYVSQEEATRLAEERRKRLLAMAKQQ